jgi:hypothetical protein
MKILYINKILLILGLVTATFFFIYAQKFSFLSIGMGKYMTIFAIILAILHWVFILHNNIIRVNKILMAYYFSILFLLCYTSLLITYQTSEFSFLYVIILRLTEFFFGSLGLVYLAKRIIKFKFREFLILLMAVILIQAIFIFLSFFSQEFLLWTIDILPSTGNIDPASIVRVRGFANAGGAGLSLVQGIGAYLSFFLFYSEKKSHYKILYLLITFLIASSTIPVGRTGLIGFSLMIFAFLFISTLSDQKISQIMSFIKYVAVGIIVAVFSYKIFVTYEYQLFLEERIFPFAFELFLNFSTSGNVTTDSTEDLKTMLFLPDSLKTFFIGDGFWEYGDGNYMNTDSGYLRVLFAVGVIGLLLFYVPLFAIFWISVLYAEKQYRVFLSILYLYMLLIEIKEPFLLKPSTGIIVLLVSFYIILNHELKVKI